MTELEDRRGKILTFYSYKGGTGRSMLLANVALVLASRGARVLVIDWDLEAPGLHRYFAPLMDDPELTDSPGIIDFLEDFVAAAHDMKDEGPRWFDRYASLDRVAFSLDLGTDEGGIDFVPAGAQGPMYAQRVTHFDWHAFYEKLGGGVFIEAVKANMRRDYDFVLVDSRTGVSDTSGICTVQLPDALVVCFALNQQNILGASAVAASVLNQRKDATGNPSIQVWPIPSRIDGAEKERLNKARALAWQEFDGLVHQLPLEQRRAYWGAIELPYEAYFAYEEVLAAFADDPTRVASLLAAYERATGYFTGNTITKLGEFPAELVASVRNSAAERAPAVAPAWSEKPGESLRERNERLAWRERLRALGLMWTAADRPATLPGGKLWEKLLTAYDERVALADERELVAAVNRELSHYRRRQKMAWVALVAFALLVGISAWRQREQRVRLEVAAIEVEAIRKKLNDERLKTTVTGTVAHIQAQLIALKARTDDLNAAAVSLSVLDEQTIQNSGATLERLRSELAELNSNLNEVPSLLAAPGVANAKELPELREQLAALVATRDQAKQYVETATNRATAPLPSASGAGPKPSREELARFQVGLGVLALRNKKPDEAAVAYERALKYWPNYPAALNGLGNVALMKGERDAAKRQYELASSAKGASWAPLYNLGLIAQQKGDYGTAREHFLNALSRSPNEPSVVAALRALDNVKGVPPHGQAPPKELAVPH